MDYLATSGWSMAPSLKPGDKIILRPCRAQDLRLGDLAVYRASGALVCHRLVFKQGSRLFTRGDSSWGWPEEVPASCIEGVAAAVVTSHGVSRPMQGPISRALNFSAIFWTPLTALAYRAAEAIKRRAGLP